MAPRRQLVFLGVFSLLMLGLAAGTALLAQSNVLRVRGHVTIAWAAMIPTVLYVLLSLRWILRVKG